MSGSVADVRSGLPAEVADLLAPPARPWWKWIVSDRAARYTARIMFLLIWQWAGTVFDDIPTPLSTVEFLIEDAEGKCHGVLPRQFAHDIDHVIAGPVVAALARLPVAVHVQRERNFAGGDAGPLASTTSRRPTSGPEPEPRAVMQR